MNKLIFIVLFIVGNLAYGQTKKPAPGVKPKKTAEPVVKDSIPVEQEVYEIPKDFAVYTRRSKTKKDRMKLCINLVNGDSILNYCMNDSLLRDPEKTKILFQEKNGDSTYVLVLAQAFTKDPARPECGAGRETKLFFVRLSNITNKAIVKQKYIESCYKTITRMNREPIEDWDGQNPLLLSYNRGAKFYDLTFDPKNYKLGLQTAGEAEK